LILGGGSYSSEDEAEDYFMSDEESLVTEGVPVSIAYTETFSLKPASTEKPRNLTEFEKRLSMINQNELGLFKNKPRVKVLK
jgi:hypothetical protein